MSISQQSSDALGPVRVGGALLGNLGSIAAVFCVLWPSLWFVDALFGMFGSRESKLTAWVVFLSVMALYVFCRRIATWTGRQGSLRVIWATLLMVSMVAYVLIRNGIQGLEYDANQIISLTTLVPIAIVLGATSDASGVVRGFLIIGVSVVVLFYVTVFQMGIDITGLSFHQFVPASTSYREGNTGYQGLSLHAGLVIAYLACVLAGIEKISSVRFLVIIAAIIAALYAQLSIGGRSPMIGSIAAFLVVAIMVLWQRRFGSIARVGLLGAMLLCGGVFLFMLSDDLLPLGVRRMLLAYEGISVGYDPTSRMELWEAAINIWVSGLSEFFFGVGGQRFPVLAGYGSSGMYPHNIILEACVEYGLLGGALIVGTLLLPLMLWMRERVLSPHRAASTSGMIVVVIFVYWFVSMQFMGSLQAVWPLYFLAYAIPVDWSGRRTATPKAIAHEESLARPCVSAT